MSAARIEPLLSTGKGWGFTDSQPFAVFWGGGGGSGGKKKIPPLILAVCGGIKRRVLLWTRGQTVCCGGKKHEFPRSWLSWITKQTFLKVTAIAEDTATKWGFIGDGGMVLVVAVSVFLGGGVAVSLPFGLICGGIGG